MNKIDVDLIRYHLGKMARIRSGYTVVGEDLSDLEIELEIPGCGLKMDRGQFNLLRQVINDFVAIETGAGEIAAGGNQRLRRF